MIQEKQHVSSVTREKDATDTEMSSVTRLTREKDTRETEVSSVTREKDTTRQKCQV